MVLKLENQKAAPILTRLTRRDSRMARRRR
jgi:hypothetical protein